MPDDSDCRSRTITRNTSSLRWWNSLAFRLGATVNVTVIVVIALSAWVDHRRDTNTQLQHAMSRLQEEANVLRAAWSQFHDANSFQRFVDGFCHQMTASASPGHHIAVFDANGKVLVRAHERAGTELERLMNESGTNSVHTFDLNDEQFAAYSLKIGRGANLVVAVSLQPVRDMLRAQGVSRAATTGILVVIIFGVTAVCLFIWVRNPLRGFIRTVGAVSEHRFDQRVKPQGAAELRYLADGINDMVQALGRTEHQRDSEMQRAREIQRTLVGERKLAINGCQIRTVFLPAASVGGDFFDIIASQDGSTLVAVLDITGHGVPGALCAALLRSSLHHLASATGDLAEIAQGLNRELCDIAAANVFATAVLLKIRPDSDTFEYVIAGHDPPLLVDTDNRGEALDHAGMMLGVDPSVCYSVAESELLPGRRIFLFTDGLHEAMSPGGEQFGRERVSELFIRTSHLSLKEQLSVALKDVRSFQQRDDFDDDVTVLAICRGEEVAIEKPSAADVALDGQDGMLRESSLD